MKIKDIKIDEIKDNIDDIKGNIDDAYSGFIKKRNGRMQRGHSFLRHYIMFVDDMRNDFVAQFAAQAAFFTVFSAVPFLMVIILSLKYIVPININEVHETISAAFPAQVSIYLSQVINEVFVRSESVAALPVTVLVALWSSSRGTMAIYCGLNQIAGYVRPYNWISARLASFFYNIILLFVITATALILIFGNSLLGLLDEKLMIENNPITALFRLKFPIFFVLLVLVFTGIFTFLPQRKMSFVRQLPGAVLTTLGWMVFSWLFSIYVDHFSKHSLIYGSLTAIILLMMWIYVCIYMLLIGAEINIHIEDGFFSRLRRNAFKRKRT